MGTWTTAITTFLAASVEVIEMVIIVVAVGTVRGWRATLVGGGSGLVGLAVIVAAFGAALSAIPIGVLRLIVGALLLVFGLQWLRKGIGKVATTGFEGTGEKQADANDDSAGFDWTAFVLAFKGVLLEGLEVAFIVVSFGATSGHLRVSILAAAVAFVVIAAAGAIARRAVERIPRSALQLIVGLMLSSFGAFWAVEGLGGSWPGNDASILGLLGLYILTAIGLVALLRSTRPSGETHESPISDKPQPTTAHVGAEQAPGRR